MKIIKPKVEVILCPVTGNDAIKIIEGIGRTCYKSEELMTDDSMEVVIPLLKWFKKLIPVIFDDIEVEK